MRNCPLPIIYVALLAFSIASWSIIPAVNAGTLVLGNGDRVSGELIGIYDEQVHWQSDLMGEVVVGQVDVQRIESRDEFRVVLDANRELTNCQLSGDADKQLLNCQQGMVELNSWKLVQRVTARPLSEPDAWRNKGSVVVAGRDRSGNNEDRTLRLDSRIELRKGPYRHIATLHYDRTSTADIKTADDRKFTYQYDYFISPKWFFNSNVSWEENQFQALESRQLIGAGLGYQFFDTELIRLSVEMGPALLREKYTDDPDRDAAAIRENTDLVVKLNSRGLEFFHRNTLLQSFDSGGDWRIETETGFGMPIIGRLKGQMMWEYDYNRRPADEAGPVDRSWSFGLDYSW
jgi:putative salt-induced outer membrane protein YdiY